jgi:cytochrome c553
MIYVNNNLAAWLALAVLLASASACARRGNTDILTGAAAISNKGPDTIKPRISGDPVAGKLKSQICQGCHGVDGNSTDEQIPKLAGQYETYISKELRNYQAGVRSHEIMNAMAATLSSKDLDDISAYFASQPKMKGNGSTPNEQGKNIFLKGNISQMVLTCVDCHGIGGKGLSPDTPMFPVIGGQHKAYLLKQLIDFREDDRVNSPNAIMNRIVRTLSNADLEALAQYISGL